MHSCIASSGNPDAVNVKTRQTRTYSCVHECACRGVRGEVTTLGRGGKASAYRPRGALRSSYGDCTKVDVAVVGMGKGQSKSKCAGKIRGADVGERCNRSQRRCATDAGSATGPVRIRFLFFESCLRARLWFLCDSVLSNYFAYTKSSWIDI